LEQTHIEPKDQAGISAQPAGVSRGRLYPQRILTLLQRYQSIVIGGVLFLAALGFDLYRLGTPSIWFDEAFSVGLARQPLPVLWQIIWGPEPNMELYYLFLHFWLQLTSALGMIPTEFLVRLPSAIFAALSTLALFLFARRFLGLWAAIVATGLYLLNDLQLVYAQQTRAYSLQLLLLCLAWYALFMAFTAETHSRRWWLCYIVTATLAFYAQLFSALILVAQVAAVAVLLLIPNAWRTQMRKRLLAFVISLLIAGILSTPMILTSRHGSKATGWLPVPHLQDISTLFMNIGANSKIFLLLIGALCVLGCLVALLASLRPLPKINTFLSINASEDEAKRGRQRLPIAIAALCWLLLPILLSFVISQGQTRIFSTRYLVTVVPALCLLAGLGVAAFRFSIVKAVIAVALLALAFHYTPLYYHNAQIEDWRTATSWLVQRYQPGDGMVCYTNSQGCQVSIEYYLTRDQSEAHFDSDTPGAFSWANDGPLNGQAGYDAAVDPVALAAYGAHHPHLFFIVARLSSDDQAAKARAAQQWLDTHYHFVGQIVTPAITIRLYATETE
jgi:uncharacterized membrane protein